jgi:hypothetical protein
MFNDFVVFYLKYNNYDCFAVYKDKKLVLVEHIEISFLPTEYSRLKRTPIAVYVEH